MPPFPETPNGESYDLAMAITDQAEATRYFRRLVEQSMLHGLTRADAETTVRSNLGYYAGYFGNDTRRRVEQLFRCEHPFFGAIAVKGPPTCEKAFAMGVALGKTGKP